MSWYFGKKGMKHGEFSTSPGVDLIPVTPNNSADLPSGVCRGLRCTVVGTVSGITANGGDRDFTFFTAGEVLPVGWQRIHATGTTATVEAIY